MEKKLNKCIFAAIAFILIALGTTVITYGAEPPVIEVVTGEVHKSAISATEIAVLGFLAADAVIVAKIGRRRK